MTHDTMTHGKNHLAAVSRASCVVNRKSFVVSPSSILLTYRLDVFFMDLVEFLPCKV